MGAKTEVMQLKIEAAVSDRILKTETLLCLSSTVGVCLNDSQK